ncbi:MAG: NYN domain-containing protein [Nanoarchaeota archaeon]|nr:NYN domain-containing protein [Nanoarchaeota archaeon]
MVKKKAIVFVDGNNWYHNVKSIIEKPRAIDFRKLASMIAEHFDLNVIEIRYYNSTPDIELGEDNYYKHMVFLASLKQKGLTVKTRKLKKIKASGKVIRVEKGIDVMISTDMMRKTLVENSCDCCVLITGDSDFVPVMQLIKKADKEVLTVSVLKGYARELLQGEFRFWILKKQDIVKCFGGYSGRKK